MPPSEDQSQHEVMSIATQIHIHQDCAWGWNCVSELLLDAIRILDACHAKERIWDLSKAIYCRGVDAGSQCAKQTVEILRAGRTETLTEALKPFATEHSQATAAIGCFDRNRERSRYQEFRDWGLSVSSAVVEAGYRNVIGARPKRGGMHRSKAGANKIAALRSSVISDRFDDFWYVKANNL